MECFLRHRQGCSLGHLLMCQHVDVSFGQSLTRLAWQALLQQLLVHQHQLTWLFHQYIQFQWWLSPYPLRVTLAHSTLVHFELKPFLFF